MTDFTLPQQPGDSRQVVRSFEDDGDGGVRAVFGQVGVEEINYRGRFGALTTSTSQNTIAIGDQYYTIDHSADNFRIGDDVLITSPDRDCYQWGEITGKDTVAEPARLRIFIDDVSALSGTYSNWEIQVVARPKLGIEKDISTSSINPTTGGPFTFTVTAGKFFPIGGKLLIKPNTDRSVAVLATVLTYSGTTLVVQKVATNATVSQSYSSWSIGLLDAPETDVDLFAYSTTTITIGKGFHIFTLATTGKFFPAGASVLITNLEDPTEHMSGFAYLYSASELRVAVTDVVGSGSSSSWVIYNTGGQILDPKTFSVSGTSLTIGTGAQTFTCETGKHFQIGSYIKLIDISDTSNFMEGPVTALGTSGSLQEPTISVSHKAGSGTVAAWLVLEVTPPIIADPGADRILFWDESANKVTALTVGTGLSITDTTIDASVSSAAPTDAQYVTLATNGTLSNERVLTAGTGIVVTDAGAGSTVTVAAPTAPVAVYSATITPTLMSGNISSVDTATDIITWSEAHLLTTGDTIIPAVGGTWPTGATTRGPLYVNCPTSTTFSLHLTRAQAVAGTSKIDLTAAGSGTRTAHKLVATNVVSSGMASTSPIGGSGTYETTLGFAFNLDASYAALGAQLNVRNLVSSAPAAMTVWTGTTANKSGAIVAYRGATPDIRSTVTIGTWAQQDVTAFDVMLTVYGTA